MKPIAICMLILSLSLALLACSKEVTTQQITTAPAKSPNISSTDKSSSSLEMRDTALWLNKSDLDKLTLDGTKYTVKKEILASDEFSHVSISYPGMILGGERIYDLESDREVIGSYQISQALKKSWGSEIAADGYIWYDDVQIQPTDFQFIDNAVFSNDKSRLCISIHSFLADIFDSVVCVYDIKLGKFKFIKSPFYGKVHTIKFSIDNKYIAYAYATGGDTLTQFVTIINPETMGNVAQFNLNQVISKQNGLDDNPQLVVSMKRLYWQEGELFVKVVISNELGIVAGDKTMTFSVWKLGELMN